MRAPFSPAPALAEQLDRALREEARCGLVIAKKATRTGRKRMHRAMRRAAALLDEIERQAVQDGRPDSDLLAELDRLRRDRAP
jgi:hypothetical protein